MESDAGASFSVNVNGGDGKVKGGKSKSNEEKALIGILKELKSMGKVAAKTAKLSASGFLGAAGKAGGVLAALASVLPLAASAAGIAERKKQKDAGESWEVVQRDGEDIYVRANYVTGEITKVLTKREAIEEGIADVAGNIKFMYDHMGSALKTTANIHDSIGDKLIVTNKELENMYSSELKSSTESAKIAELQEARRILLEKIIKDISGHAHVYGDGPKLPYNDTVGKQSVPDAFSDPSLGPKLYNEVAKTRNFDAAFLNIEQTSYAPSDLNQD